MEENDIIVPTDWVQTNEIIKVVGVGGGGVNAVTYMYNQRIEGCTFIVCNTDRQSLEESNVPLKIQLGPGRGAGTDPTKGRNYAIEAQDKLEEVIFNKSTEMLFITAGMGGGTGTGAAPVIASMAKQKGILTVAVVTLPFKNEQNESMSRAIDGIHELENNVDSLLIINNEKLYEFYGDLLIQNAFPKTDEVLATAVRAVVDIIQTRGFVNVDFEDVKKMMHDSGMAMMGCGTGKGETRIQDAIRQALESPLLNDCDLKTAKNTLINITAGRNDEGLLMNELKDIDELIQHYTGNANRFKRGIVYSDEPEYHDKINITVIATGFKMNTLERMADVGLGNMIFIDSNFEYNKKSEEPTGEIPLSNFQLGIKIGPNMNYNVRKFNYDEDHKPVLSVSRGQDLSELENIPAIYRRTVVS